MPFDMMFVWYGVPAILTLASLWVFGKHASDVSYYELFAVIVTAFIPIANIIPALALLVWSVSYWLGARGVR